MAVRLSNSLVATTFTDTLVDQMVEFLLLSVISRLALWVNILMKHARFAVLPGGNDDLHCFFSLVMSFCSSVNPFFCS